LTRAPGQALQDARPSHLSEPIGENPGPFGVRDPQKGVFKLPILDPVAIHLAGEPFMAVEVNLGREGKPGGHAHMHKTQLRIDKIEVEAQTLAPGTDQMGALRSISQLETPAGFHRREHAYEPFSDPITLGNGPRFILLADRPVQSQVGAPCCFGHLPAMGFDPLGVFGHELLEMLQQKSLSADEPLHALSPADGQVSFKNDPVKTGYRSADFCAMLCNKSLHGVLPSVVVGNLPP